MSQDNHMRSLAKETAVYGLSSIVGKFLNWLLVPLYTYVLESKADYGIVTNLYAWTALLLVILTYGMETGFFRFANKEDKSPATVYTTTLISLFTTSLVFAVLVCCFRIPIAEWMQYEGHEDFIALLAIVVAMDAFASIPFAYLRYKKRSLAFAGLKLLFVGLNILLNIFFLVLCPRWSYMGWISLWYEPTYGVGYVFVANIIATGIQTLCLLPAIFAEKFHFSFSLLREMLRYSLPLLILGVAGIMNQTVDKILFPYLYPGGAEAAETQLGIYGACFKVAMVMMMFTQAFRYAYEPFVFSKHKDKNSVDAYADAMKYYIIFSFLIFLGMIVYLDIIKLIIAPTYWEGLRIIPYVLWAYIFQGVYFNLSFWYKLTDNTRFGAYFSILGCLITIAIQVIFVPTLGYMASAISSTICFGTIMLLSYFVGEHYLKIPYDLKRIGLYTLLVVVLMTAYYMFRHFVGNELWSMAFGTVLVVIYLVCVVHWDFPLSAIPVIGKYFKKKEIVNQ